MIAMDLVAPENGLIVWQVLGLVLLAVGIAFFGYMGYLVIKALKKYNARH